jgi:hypothetical protein
MLFPMGIFIPNNFRQPVRNGHQIWPFIAIDISRGDLIGSLKIAVNHHAIIGRQLIWNVLSSGQKGADQKEIQQY